jgi:hypothetical protein
MSPGNSTAGESRTRAVVTRGVRSNEDWCALSNAVLCDLIDGRITPGLADRIQRARARYLRAMRNEATLERAEACLPQVEEEVRALLDEAGAK